MAQPAKRGAAARARGDETGGTAGEANAIVIKKYANRRLYNTSTSTYVTLDHLCQMVKDGHDFVVYDAKTGEDITRSVLTQIIVEEEGKGQNLLPIGFLRQLISFYGDNLQMVVPGYLEQVMSAFAANQDHMRAYMQETLGGLFPFARIDEMSRQNMAMLERTVKMFAPYGPGGTGAPAAGTGQAAAGSAPAADPAPAANRDDAIRALKQQVDLLQRQLETLAPSEPPKPD